MKTGKGILLGGLGAVALIAIGIPLVNVISAPGRVASETLKTDNIIGTYEQFFDIRARYAARISQIDDHALMISQNQDPAEAARLRVELSAIRASCRDLAQQYNANAIKANKALFKSRDLPSKLEEAACEA